MAINDFTKQVSTLLNSIMEDAYGGKAVSQIDVTNLSSVFDYVTSSTDRKKVFFSALYGRIGAEIYAARVYNRDTLPFWRDSREFGALILKTYMHPVEAIDNPVYGITDGMTANTFTVSLADIETAIVENSETWACELTVPYDVLKDAFTTAETLGAFIESQYTILENSMEDKMEKIENMLLTRFMALKLTTTVEGVHAVNLLEKFNETQTTDIKAADALSNLEFLKFANKVMFKDMRLMSKRGKMFNTSEFIRHTPKENAVVLMLQDYVLANTMNLQSDTYHKELVSLPKYQDVPYWQAAGVAGEFNSVSQINVKTTGTGAIDVTQTGILAIIYDEYAIAATMRDRRQPTITDDLRNLTHTSAQAKVQLYCDPSENAVVYYIEDAPTP